MSDFILHCELVYFKSTYYFADTNSARNEDCYIHVMKYKHLNNEITESKRKHVLSLKRMLMGSISIEKQTER